MLDYEWATAQHGWNCRLASRVLAPQAIPLERMARIGARPPKLIGYPGLKEEYYLADFEPDETVLGPLGVDRGQVLCVVRTAPSYALYLRGAEDAFLPRLLRHLNRAENARTVVLPRTAQQGTAVAALGLERVIVPDRALDGASLVALADVLVSAGGTMNREAAVMGTPAFSIFEGRLGAVDEMLIREGRLRMLEDPEQVEVVKKDPASLRDRVRRDPEEMLRMALPPLLETPARER
jgi:predicted glycosyltransferase